MNENTRQDSQLLIMHISSVILLLGIGFGFLFSASQPAGIKFYGSSYHYIIKQGFYLIVGLLMFIVGFFVNHNQYGKYIKVIILSLILLLIITLIPGISKEVGGARRWIVVGGFQFQPSEIAKFVIILYLSYVLSGKKELIKDFYKGVLPPLLIVGVISILIFLENDFSTTFLIILITIVLFYLAGIKIFTLIMMFIVGTVSGILMIFFAPYRISRLFAFINPWEDPLGTGWHYIQSMKCFALGGWFGKGIGESQQKLFALPEAHNDYIYAIIGEEGGAFVSVLILILFMVFTIIGLMIAKRSKNKYSFLLASGLTLMIFFQAIINIGVVVSILPATGVTLPFMSAGGTSLIMFMFSVGVLANISFSNSRRDKDLTYAN